MTEKSDLHIVTEMTPQPGARSAIRRTHEERVLASLRDGGALSRGELARRVGLSRTTLSEITTHLLARGAVVVVDTDSASRRGSGRPAERLALDPASGQFLGVDFGHRRVQVAVADASHAIIADGTRRYADGTDWGQRVDLAFDLIERITNDHSVHLAALQSIGIGVPGPHRGTHAPTVTWHQQPAPEQVDRTFAERYGALAIVDNNTRLAALAEAVSAPDPAANLMYVRLSDGVGGGLVVAGRLVTGARGYAGEVGHVIAVPDGDACQCGKRGCLETVASVPAILAACRARGAKVDDLDDLAAAVAAADPRTTAALRQVGATLGRVLGAAAMVLDPDEVVIGGELVHAAPVLVEQVSATLRSELYPVSTVEPVRVRAGRLRDGDGALGALAALFRQSSLLSDYPDHDDNDQPKDRRRAQ